MDRTEPPRQAGELRTLTAFLDFHRATALRKVAGLTGEQARSRPVPASALTPLGVVKHLAATERWWFSIDFAGLDVPPPGPEGDGNFDLTPADTVAAVCARYAEECAASRAAIEGAGLDDVSKGTGVPPFSLRYALVHMVEETARHCGHLDLLREAVDGVRGT
jgi:Protein of unknown function (DUF664)